jgi:hypothetical protein
MPHKRLHYEKHPGDNARKSRFPSFCLDRTASRRERNPGFTTSGNYLEGDLEKEIFERRKEKLLFDLKAKKDIEKQLIDGNDKVLDRVNKFLGLAKNLKTAYENADLAEQRQIIEIVTSDLVVEGKKLLVSIASPFLEMSQHRNFTTSEHGRYEPWTQETKIAFPGINPPSASDEPLSKDQLKLLLELIIATVSQLPETNQESSYGI